MWHGCCAHLARLENWQILLLCDLTLWLPSMLAHWRRVIIPCCAFYHYMGHPHCQSLVQCRFVCIIRQFVHWNTSSCLEVIWLAITTHRVFNFELKSQFWCFLSFISGQSFGIPRACFWENHKESADFNSECSVPLNFLFYHLEHCSLKHIVLGGVMIGMLAIGPKFHGFKLRCWPHVLRFYGMLKVPEE
jgi:hypothetical protein